MTFHRHRLSSLVYEGKCRQHLSIHKFVDPHCRLTIILIPTTMQSLLEYEAEERHYQSLTAAGDPPVEGMTSLPSVDPPLLTMRYTVSADTDVTPAPPSYTAEATPTPWVSHPPLPAEPEAACDVSLDSIPEDAATSSSLGLSASPSTQPIIIEEPTDSETETSPVHDSGTTPNRVLVDFLCP